MERFRVFSKWAVCISVPPSLPSVLGGGAPVYEREYKEPCIFQKV